MTSNKCLNWEDALALEVHWGECNIQHLHVRLFGLKAKLDGPEQLNLPPKPSPQRPSGFATQTPQA